MLHWDTILTNASPSFKPLMSLAMFEYHEKNLMRAKYDRMENRFRDTNPLANLAYGSCQHFMCKQSPNSVTSFSSWPVSIFNICHPFEYSQMNIHRGVKIPHFYSVNNRFLPCTLSACFYFHVKSVRWAQAECTKTIHHLAHRWMCIPCT